MSTVKSAPAPLFLPFDRCAAIAKLTPQQRADEYNRARMVEVLVEGRQKQFVGQARKGSLFSADELLAMVSRFNHVDDWRGGNLWRMLGIALQPNAAAYRPVQKLVKEAPIVETIVETIPRDKLRAAILANGNTYANSLAISRLARVNEATVRAFMNGRNIRPLTAVKLAKVIEAETAA